MPTAPRQEPTSFNAPALSRTARRNQARRARHRVQHDAAPPLPLKNAFAPLEHVSKEGAVTRPRDVSVHTKSTATARYRQKGKAKATARYRQKGKAKATLEEASHYRPVARRNALHHTVQQPSFKKRAPVATTSTTQQHQSEGYRVHHAHHVSAARSTHRHGGAPGGRVEWRPVRSTPTHTSREAAPTGHGDNARSTPVRKLQEGAPASAGHHQHSSSSKHDVNVQLEGDLRKQLLGESSKPLFQWQRKSHKVKSVIVDKEQQTFSDDDLLTEDLADLAVQEADHMSTDDEPFEVKIGRVLMIVYTRDKDARTAAPHEEGADTEPRDSPELEAHIPCSF